MVPAQAVALAGEWVAGSKQLGDSWIARLPGVDRLSSQAIDAATVVGDTAHQLAVGGVFHGADGFHTLQEGLGWAGVINNVDSEIRLREEQGKSN